MKKTVLLLLTLAAALFPAAGCSNAKRDVPAFLYEKGLVLIEEMDRMAESPEYRGAVSGSDELEQLIEKLGREEYSEPEAVYSITLPWERLLYTISLSEGTHFPEDVKNITLEKLFLNIPFQINAAKGTSVLAAASSINTSSGFVCRELKEKTLYLYYYDTEYSAMAAFLPQNDGAVTASVSFINTEDLTDGSSPEGVAEWLMGSVLSGARVEPVTLPGNPKA